jgi:hypothetical protein
VRLAVILWLVLGAVVWNVVFDRVLVMAGRHYAYDAALAGRNGGPYLLINERMPAAIRRGIRLATAAGGGVAAAGLLAIAAARRRERKHTW